AVAAIERADSARLSCFEKLRATPLPFRLRTCCASAFRDAPIPNHLLTNRGIDEFLAQSFRKRLAIGIRCNHPTSKHCVPDVFARVSSGVGGGNTRLPT